MKKNIKLVALLTNLKNSLAPETKDEVKKAFDEAIAEAEAATTEVSAEDLVKLVEEKMAATMATKADVATLANMLQEKVIVNKAQDYLKSKKALTAFYNTIKNSTRDTFRKNWAEVLKKEISNDIDPNGALLPVEIVQSIVDRIQKAGSLFGMLNHTGLKAIRVPVNAMAEDSDTSRAGRHTKGQDKAAQVWDLSPKTILAQAIFKLLPVDYETMRQVDDESMLVAYITNELTNAWVNEVERAILVGDGRTSSDPRHISSFEKLAVAATTNYITVIQNAASPAVITMELVKQAVDSINTDGRLVLVLTKQNKTILAKQVFATGGTTQYLSDATLAEQLGVAKIITNKFVTSANGALAIVMDVDAYQVVGDTRPEQINQYDIYKNQNVFELVGMAGGAFGKFEAGAVVKP
jgi:hypothetical protein